MLERQHFAISEHGLCVIIPTRYDIRIFMTTEEYLCMLNQARYPIETLE